MKVNQVHFNTVVRGQAQEVSGPDAAIWGIKKVLG